MAGTSKACWALLPLSVAVLLAVCGAITGPDLPPGPYCAARPDSCCQGREDRCSAPILGTLCYCDDFCNRTINEDCCPDFWSHCHGVEPIIDPNCNRDGRVYHNKQKIMENCNECVCVSQNGQAEMVCESDRCLIEGRLIESVNRDPAITWRAVNHTLFWGHKLKEGLIYRLGTTNPQKSTRGMYPLQIVYDPKSLPHQYSAMEQWPGQLAPIQDQGWCGSSWAISTAAVASDKFLILSKGREHPQLSAQQLVSCNSRGQKSCNGGYLDRAWQFIRKFGLVNEECLPYTAREDRCKILNRGSLLAAGCSLPNDSTGRKERYRVSPAYKLGNETDIMYEILNSGPVQATMRVYQDFFSYETGIYRRSSSTRDEFGYHSVRLIGWGQDDGIKYWLAANSWGQSWGEDGYFKIVRGVNECEIETFVIGAWAKTIRDHDNRTPVGNLLRRG